MRNFDQLKQNAIEKILGCQTPEELYEFFAEEQPFEEIMWNCEICSRHFERCSETLNDDGVCRERFVTWCERNAEQI